MTTSRLLRAPLWATLLIALVAAMVSYFVFVQSSEAAQATNGPPSAKTPRIIGGKLVPNGKYPFMSYLTIAFTDGPADANNKPDVFNCGGSLIDADSVLTAAHCITPDTASQSLLGVKVVVGRTVLSSNQGQVRFTTKAAVHPKHDPARLHNYDAAVLQLNRKVIGIEPIKLATSKQNYLERPGRDAKVAGWGNTTQTPACPPFPQADFPNHMREAQVPIISDSKAAQAYRQLPQCAGELTFVPQLMIAAGGKGKDTCQGDSGGPLFVRTPGNGDGDNGDGDNGDDDRDNGGNGGSSGKYTQIGITSFGPGCAYKDFPGAYTEVNNPSIRSFITNAARK
jgi:secreted trypsin-like serine protease